MITGAAVETSSLRPQPELSAEERGEMFELFTKFFEDVSRPQFERDLAEKHWVVRLHREQRLVGFTSLLVRDFPAPGGLCTAIYSGDTIVSPEAWGTPALARAWIAAVNHLRLSRPQQRCYWLLLTSGYRTYRFLPVFWRTFYPRCDEPVPAEAEALRHALATAQYGDRYDPTTGIVRFAHPQRLRGPMANVAPARTTDPHIAFFLARNPNYRDGDELVCVTEISDENLTRAGKRMVKSGAP